MSQLRCLFILAVCLFSYSALSIHAQPRYTVTPLGALQPGGMAGPYIVGSENGLPVRLNINTMQKTILGHAGHGGVARAVLSTGEAVGSINLPNPNVPGELWSTATFWDSQGQQDDLPGLLPSYASGINASGTISGVTSCADSLGTARWWGDGRTEACGPRGWAVGIDDRNRVFVGANPIPLVWDVDGSVHALDTPPGPLFFAVNRHGVAGGSTSPSPRTPWLSSLEGGLKVLPPVTPLYGYPGDLHPSCEVFGLNAVGDAVGGCAPGANPVSPVLWPAAGSAVDLHFLAPDLPLDFWHEMAVDINDTGHIVVSLQPIGSSRWHHFLLSPIPERVAECGGSVPCQCGDTVVQDYTFTAHLGPCAAQGTDAGLVIASGVTVNGNGYRIAGTRGGTGLLFDGVAGSQVIGVHVLEFANGVKMRGGASGNVYRDAWVWSHTQHGVWLDQAGDNWVWGINSVLNGASGIMLSDASSNTIGQSDVWGNLVSLHMTRADRNIIYVNGLFGDAGHAAILDDSHGNSFYWNTLICRNGNAIILHNSDDNSAIGNVIDCPVRRDEALARR